MKENKSKHLNNSSYTYQDCPDMEELTNKFGPKKSDSLLLSNIYSEIGQTNRSLRVADCGSFLEFSHDFNAETGEFSDKGRLTSANFCRDLLCPMCSWRKSLKQIAQISKVLNHETIRGRYKYLMLTLTIPNVCFSNLSFGIDKLLSAFDRLMRRKKYRNIIRGFYRSLEVTINEKTHTFHPHLHVMLLVSLSYGTRGLWLSRNEILSDWQNACRDDSITQVDIRLAYNPKNAEISQDSNFTIESAALELAKYAAKVPTRCYKPEIISSLLEGLAHRRSYSYGGVLKEAFVALGLEELEESDLVHINDDVPDPVMSMIVRYGWTPSGYQILNTRMEGGNADDSFKVC